MSDTYGKYSKALQPFLDRPLISLLPFYLWGIVWGWNNGGGMYAWPLAASAGCAAMLISLSFFRLRLNKYLILLLIPAVFLLGAGLASRSISEPEHPRHLIHFTSSERFPEYRIVGGVVKESIKRPDSRYQRLIIDSREIIKAGAKGPDEILAVKGLARIDVTGGAMVQPGDYVRLPVQLRRLSGFRNPGGVNPEKYWAGEGVWVNGYVRDPALISSWPGYTPPGLMRPGREKAAEFLYDHAPYPAAGLLASLLLGRRSEVDGESETVFRNLGLSHILSVSGLHMGLCYGLCLWLALFMVRRLAAVFGKYFGFSGQASSGRISAAAGLLALGPTLYYAALVGGASPVIRSAVMVAAAGLALVLRRGADTWNILAAAAWLILLAEPQRLFSASFQMSFVATAALVAVFRPRPRQRAAEFSRPQKSLWNTPLSLDFVKSLFTKEKADDWPTRREPLFRNIMLASAAGTFGTAPLVAWHFSRLPLAGLAGNLIFGPFLSLLVLIPGLLSLMLLPFCEAAAALLMDFSAGVLMFLMPVMEAAAQAAGPGPLLPFFGKFFLAAYFLAGWLFLRSPWPLKKRLAASVGILALGLAPWLLNGPGERGVLRFTVLDVGQGSALHISFPDRRQMIIDGGGSLYFDPGERIVTPYLLRQGIGKLDYAALTHPDEDHLKGLISLCRNFKADEIWSNPWPEDFSPLYAEFLQATAQAQRPAPAELWNGYLIGPVKIESLWPEPRYEWPARPPNDSWANNLGQVFKISWGDISFLVTGDIEKKTERRLVEMYGPKLAATVLVAPHHGSSASMSEEFLKAVKADHVVFSVGRHNYFGHPTPQSLELAAQNGAAIHRTDYDGAAVFEVRETGGRLELKTPR